MASQNLPYQAGRSDQEPYGRVGVESPPPVSTVQIMISYARTDSTFVDQLQRDLQLHGFPVWLDRSDIDGGAPWADDIYAAIDSAQVVLLVCSPAALRSRWVRREYQYALSQSKVVIPLRYQPCRLPRALNRLQALDFLIGPDFEAKYARQLELLGPMLAGYAPVDGSPLPPKPRGRGGRTPGQRKVQPRVKDRQRFLTKIATRYSHRLDDALQGAVLLDLGLSEHPEAVEQPGLATRETGEPSARPLPQGTSVTDVYSTAEGHVLILGAPGAGKTTQLVQLGRQLVERARLDQAVPMPVVLNLSSWAAARLPLSAWMSRELADAYNVPRALARAWVEADEILPLLDGLDEVEQSTRTACADAINVYRRGHGLVPLVVCCRTEEYQALGTRLGLQTAVELQPLTDGQVDEALARGGEQLAGLREALRADPPLRELTTTPLVLNVMILAYAGQGQQAVPLAEGEEAFRKRLFSDYVTRMLQRRPGKVRYPQAQVVQELSWLAMQMKEHARSEFYLERMQPDWLPDPRSTRRYRGTVRRVTGLITGLTVGLAVGLGFTLEFSAPDSFGPTSGPVVGLISGLVLGTLSGLIVSLTTQTNYIKPAETLSWSWQTLLVAMYTFGGLAPSAQVVGQLDERDLSVPNEGIRNSLKNGVRSLLIGALIIAIAVFLTAGLSLRSQTTQSQWLPEFLGVEVFWVLIGALIYGLRGGFGACIRYWAFNRQLRRSKKVPRHYVTFLNFCADHILLQRIGGGYRFVHALLLDYFAGLYADPTGSTRA